MEAHLMRKLKSWFRVEVDKRSQSYASPHYAHQGAGSALSQTNVRVQPVKPLARYLKQGKGTVFLLL